ncbi:MAG: 50S ribosomal protein L9 [Armatimonadetes bacterium]|nr:50S ribosomal protein L9 [Candidatus Hippobium faecium]
MKVILLKDIKGLGKNGDVVNVSEGYARNMLIPTKAAAPATDTILRQVKEKQASEKAKDAKNKADAEAVSEMISKEKLVIKAKAGQNSKLFGAVTNHEIADAINSKYSLDIDKKKVVLKDSIKAVGTYTAEIKLYSGVTSKVTVEIIAE